MKRDTNPTKITGKSQRGQQVPEFTEDQAREYFEKMRWDGNPCCVHCGSVNVTRLQGASARPGTLQCNEPECREQFTVTVGSVMEDTHLPLATWAKAFHLVASSKKGVSALQLQRQLGLGSYRTAWHLAHRIRLAMTCEPVAGMLKGVVESDEVWIGGKPRKINYVGAPGVQGKTDKQPVQTLVERNGRKVSVVLPAVTADNLKANIDAIVDKTQSKLMTDENSRYNPVGIEFSGGHVRVDHGIHEYARPIEGAHVNTCESAHALLKRGIVGSFHHVSVKHLHRYLNEFDFRWNAREVTDTERRDEAVKGAEGKRLMYREPGTPQGRDSISRAPKTPIV